MDISADTLALAGLIIALAGLIITLFAWLRQDIKAQGERHDGAIKALGERLDGLVNEIKALSETRQPHRGTPGGPVTPAPLAGQSAAAGRAPVAYRH